MSRIRVGISGWTYAPWRGDFYPDALPQKHELGFASRRFNALEVNGTFYSLQKPSSFASWREATPDDFVFALKGGRYITHIRRLRDVRAPLANFLASGLFALREKLGPILWQFPPSLRYDPALFDDFLAMLPRDTAEAGALAEEHDPFLKGRVLVEPDARRPMRHAVEFRHASFLTDRFLGALRAHNVSLVVADVAGKFPTTEDITADWVYVRLHGSRRLYQSGYGPKELDAWAEKVRAWRDGGEPDEPRRIGPPAPKAPQGRDVFVFFDNTDVKLRAPVDARSFARTVGVGPTGTVPQVLKDLGVKKR